MYHNEGLLTMFLRDLVARGLAPSSGHCSAAWVEVLMPGFTGFMARSIAILRRLKSWSARSLWRMEASKGALYYGRRLQFCLL